jgi:uncharacterized glyoxalase superfamily protein PhnB
MAHGLVLTRRLSEQGVHDSAQRAPYGLREYGVRDLENHRWWFSSPLAD